MPIRPLALALALGAGLARAGSAQPAALAPPVAAASPSPPAAAVAARVGALLDAADVNALWAAKIVSLDTGAVLFERHPRLLMLPASTMKLVTLAVAAERLGWDARFATRVDATGPIEDGVLRGDLIVSGSGDPMIGVRDDLPRVLEDWACRLATLGLTRVEGRLIGDDDALPDQLLGTGWPWDDLAFGYAAPIGALQFHENSAQLVIQPGAEPGALAAMRLEPASTDLILTGAVVTSRPEAPAQVFTRRRPFTRVLDVTGSVPRTGREYVRTVAVDNPTHAFLAALRAALAAEGIAVTGEAVDIDDLAARPAPVRTALHVHHSPTLAEIGVRLMKVSQNLIAETLMLQVGLVSDTPDIEPLIAARGGYERTLERWGVPPESVIIGDGSGLSRYDYLTVEALVTVLTRMAQDPRHAAPFLATLPIMGVDGTLERRLRGTPAQGRIQAKTGTIANVRALAGYLTTAAGERLAFAILANNYKARAAAVDAVVDRVLLDLVGTPAADCCRGPGSR